MSIDLSKPSDSAKKALINPILEGLKIRVEHEKNGDIIVTLNDTDAFVLVKWHKCAVAVHDGNRMQLVCSVAQNGSVVTF